MLAMKIGGPRAAGCAHKLGLSLLLRPGEAALVFAVCDCKLPGEVFRLEPRMRMQGAPLRSVYAQVAFRSSWCMSRASPRRTLLWRRAPLWASRRRTIAILSTRIYERASAFLAVVPEWVRIRPRTRRSRGERPLAVRRARLNPRRRLRSRLPRPSPSWARRRALTAGDSLLHHLYCARLPKEVGAVQAVPSFEFAIRRCIGAGEGGVLVDGGRRTARPLCNVVLPFGPRQIAGVRRAEPGAKKCVREAAASVPLACVPARGSNAFVLARSIR